MNGWVAFTQHIPKEGYQREYHSELKEEDMEIVIELYQVDRQPMRDVLPRLLKIELDKEQRFRHECEAENHRLQALINVASDQAAQRECHLTKSAVRIQYQWRKVLALRQIQRQRAETDRQLKQAKLVEAIVSFLVSCFFFESLPEILNF